MPENLEQHSTFGHNTEIYYPGDTEEKEIIYPEQREDDMGETSVHITLVANFLNVLKLFLKEREDVFLSANMNLYYEESNPNKWYAPDILIAFGVPNHDRPSYQIWKEPVPPQVIFEVSSQRTWKTDISEKLEIYAQIGVEEYFILDPGFEFLPAPLMAFHLSGDRLLTTPVNNDRIVSARLGLEIVRTENNFRLYNPKTATFLLTLDESEERRHKVESELEILKAEIERLRLER